MSELANNKSIRKEVNDLGETLGITPKGKNNQQKIRSIGEQASDGTYATKEYVNTLMSGALKRLIVEALPETNIDTNTIYMVLDQSASQQGNVYNEYLYINEAWELIGTTATSGGGLDIVELDSDSGNVDLPLPTAFSVSAISLSGASGLLFMSGSYVETIITEQETIFVNHTTYSSTMSKDGTYLLMDITMPTDLLGTASYVITEHSVGGGVEYVELNFAQGQTLNLTQEQETKLQNGAFIKFMASNDFIGIAFPCSDTEYSTAPMVGGKGVFVDSCEIDFENNTYVCIETELSTQ